MIHPADDRLQNYNRACRPPPEALENLPKLMEFKHGVTRRRVFTHRSLNARPNAVFEDPPDDIAPDNETLEFVGDSVLNLTVATLVSTKYRESPPSYWQTLLTGHTYSWVACGAACSA